LAIKLGQLREKRGLKQNEVENFSQTSVSRLEKRRDIKISTLVEYLNSLGMGLEIKTYPKDKSVESKRSIIKNMSLPAAEAQTRQARKFAAGY
jgi:transcriptional regulator with XRE-family HTH domain